MKRLFISLLAISFFAFNGNAQVKRDVTQSQKVQSDSSRHFKKGKMMSDLNLSADQKSQMKEIQQSNKQQREAVKNDASLTPNQKRMKMKELQKSQSDKVNSILTPDQQAKRKTNIKQMKANRGKHGTKGFNKKRENANSSSVSQS